MRVTADIFSGRPNPTWQLDSSRSAELVERCRALTGATPADAAGASRRLGFRGFDVEATAANEAGIVPQPMRIAVHTPAVTDTEVDTARWLLGTAEATIADDVAQVVDEEIEHVAATRSAPASTRSAVAADDDLAATFDDRACMIRATPMRLTFWNTLWVQPNNNCYNYATNFVSGSIAQPGRRSGRMYSGFTCDHVLDAARRDGLSVECGRDVGVVALGIWPGFDFHWWRLHPHRSWAHKIGRWPAQNVDNVFRQLSNGLTPANCDRGPYTQFCGYYFVPMSMWVR